MTPVLAWWARRRRRSRWSTRPRWRGWCGCRWPSCSTPRNRFTVTAPERLRRPGLRRRRAVRLGLHRRAAGPGARAGRPGPAVGHRDRRPLPERLVTLPPGRRRDPVVTGSGRDPRRPARGAAARLRRHRLPAGAAGQPLSLVGFLGRWRAGRCGCCRSCCSGWTASATTSCGTAVLLVFGVSCWPRSGRGSAARPGPGCAGRSGSSRPGPSTRVLGAVACAGRGLAPGVVRRRGRARRGTRAAGPGHRQLAHPADDRPGGARADRPALRRLPRPARPRGLPAGLRRGPGRADPPGDQSRTPRSPPRGASAAAGASVVKITGVAAACNRGQEGSGWVVSPGRVVTNAHVVAGVARRACGSRASGGPRRPGRGLRPAADLAVLDVPGCARRRCARATSSAAATVRWWPGSRWTAPTGWTRPGCARSSAPGATTSTARPAPCARSTRSTRGSSRATPAARCSPGGRVVGIVFAKSLDDVSTGYALTLGEAPPVLDAGPGGDRTGRHRRLRRGLTTPLRLGRLASAEAVEPADEVGVDGVRGLLGQEVPGAGD